MVEVVPVSHHHDAVHQVGVERLMPRELHAALRLRRRAWLQVRYGRPRRGLRPRYLPWGGDRPGDRLGGSLLLRRRRALSVAARVDQGRLELRLELGRALAQRVALGQGQCQG